MDDEPTLVLEETGETFFVESETTIGRRTDNTIVLIDDPKISRQHAMIYVEGEDFFVKDNGSANGTYLNETRISEPHQLNDKDTLRFGNTTFTFKLPYDYKPTLVGAKLRPPADVEPRATASPAYAPESSLVKTQTADDFPAGSSLVESSPTADERKLPISVIIILAAVIIVFIIAFFVLQGASP